MAYDPAATENWLVCFTCGTQFPTADRSAVTTCFICDDPRQFTPPSGQSFTTLAEMRKTYTNRFVPLPGDEDRIVSIASEPKFGIGQRAILIRTPAGNIMWDCISLLDEATVARIRELGGLRAIVISHPHYYSAHVEWARAFDCPVYMSAEDREWTAQSSMHQVFVSEVEHEVAIDGRKTGAKLIKLGGHFPGSNVLLFDGRLMIADTLLTTASGRGSWAADAAGAARQRPAGMNSFSFMWSIPNYIPLPPDEIARMWGILKDYDYRSTHGPFFGLELFDEGNMRNRVFESMQIQIKAMGWAEHPFLKESL